MADSLTNVMSLSGQGLRDWVIQRISSVFLGVYVVFLFGYIVFHSGLQFYDWYNLFQNVWMRIFSALALISLILHAWIGVWTIATDYLKVTWLRFIFETVVIIALISYLIWGIEILFTF